MDKLVIINLEPFHSQMTSPWTDLYFIQAIKLRKAIFYSTEFFFFLHRR